MVEKESKVTEEEKSEKIKNKKYRSFDKTNKEKITYKTAYAIGKEIYEEAEKEKSEVIEEEKAEKSEEQKSKEQKEQRNKIIKAGLEYVNKNPGEWVEYENNMTKTLQVQIVKPYNKADTKKDEEITWEELGKQLFGLRIASGKILNYVIQQQCLLDVEYKDYYDSCKKAGEKPKDKKDYIKQREETRGSFYKQIQARFPGAVAPANLNSTIRKAEKEWKKYSKSAWKLEMSLPSFSKKAPIIIRAKQYQVICEEKGTYYIDAQLFDSGKDKYKYQFIIKAGDNSKKTILNRILSGEYKQGDLEILRRKDKWFCQISYSFAGKERELDKNKILGVDMGVTNAVCWAVSDSYVKGWIAGGEIEEYRKRIRARRSSIQQQGKHSGDGRSGHGRKRKLKPTAILSEKESNYRNTINHRYAKTIVKNAIKNNCGTIQLENLSEISTDNKFLQNWPYYDLRMKIEYKAREQGIEVKIVEPQYTSQRCSKCGHIAAENRDRKKTGFECVECGYGRLYVCKDCSNKQQEKKVCVKCGSTNTYKEFVHADYNAARNLAVPDIDMVIKNEIENANPK